MYAMNSRIIPMVVDWKAVHTSILFSVISIAMILINKGVATFFSSTMSGVLLLQNFATICLLRCFSINQLFFSRDIAYHWLPCSLFFCLNIFSSLKAMTYVNVPTFTLLRNLQPIIVVFLNLLAATESNPSSYSVFYLCCILFGAYVYAYHDLAFDWNGYIWCFIHVMSMSFYAIAVKFKSSFKPSHQPITKNMEVVESQTFHIKLLPEEMSWYNNILSIPIFITVFMLENSMAEFKHSYQNTVQCLQRWDCCVLTSTSFLGAYAVSVFGFKAQTILSPLTFVTLNNISKFPAILLSLYFWPSTMNGMEWVGICFAVISAYFYSLTRQNLLSETQVSNNTVASIFVLNIIYIIIFMFHVETPHPQGWALPKE